MPSPDMTDLLERGAAAPPFTPDVEQVWERGQRRRRRKRFAVRVAVASAVIAVVGGVALFASMFAGRDAPFVESGPPLRATSTPSVQTGQGEARVELRVEPARVAPTALPDTWLANRGEIDLYYAPQCSIDRWDGDTWVQIPQPMFNPPDVLEPGQRSPREQRPCFLTSRLGQGSQFETGPVSQPLPPGWYRVRWQVTALGPRLDNPRMEAAATFQITQTPTTPIRTPSPATRPTERTSQPQTVFDGERRWSEAQPDSYTMTVTVDCFCPSWGTWEITVQDGSVQGRVTDDRAEPSKGEVPIVARLYEWAIARLQRFPNADVNAAIDEQGIPWDMDVDAPNAIDEELRWSIQRFEANP